MVSLNKCVHSFFLIIPVDIIAIPVDNKPLKRMNGIFEGLKGRYDLVKKINNIVKKEKIKILRIKDKDRFTSCFFMHRFICKIRANDCVINDAKATPGIESNGKRTKISTKLNPKIKTKIRFIDQRLPEAVSNVP